MEQAKELNIGVFSFLESTDGLEAHIVIIKCWESEFCTMWEVKNNVDVGQVVRMLLNCGTSVQSAGSWELISIYKSTLCSNFIASTGSSTGLNMDTQPDTADTEVP